MKPSVKGRALALMRSICSSYETCMNFSIFKRTNTSPTSSRFAADGANIVKSTAFINVTFSFSPLCRHKVRPKRSHRKVTSFTAPYSVTPEAASDLSGTVVPFPFGRMHCRMHFKATSTPSLTLCLPFPLEVICERRSIYFNK